MLSAHLCGDEFLITDADKAFIRVPSMLRNRHGFEMLSIELEKVEGSYSPGEYQIFLRGIIAAFRLLHPAGVVNEPEAIE
jgi:hypothetical protein